ncbi:MAG: hypothetical protein II393_00050 [Cytophagales bacterium]|nr:hypothetical protein [Cytophagales bacterium]
MLIKFNGKIDDISMILVSAERYALGRQTYIVQWTCRLIKDNLHLLTDKDRQVMINDIKNANYYGDSIDEEEWLNLLILLKKERN